MKSCKSLHHALRRGTDVGHKQPSIRTQEWSPSVLGTVWPTWQTVRLTICLKTVQGRPLTPLELAAPINPLDSRSRNGEGLAWGAHRQHEIAGVRARCRLEEPRAIRFRREDVDLESPAYWAKGHREQKPTCWEPLSDRSRHSEPSPDLTRMLDAGNRFLVNTWEEVP